MKNLHKANLAILISASLVTTALAGIACEDHYTAKPVNGVCIIYMNGQRGATNSGVTPGGCGPSRRSSDKCRRFQEWTLFGKPELSDYRVYPDGTQGFYHCEVKPTFTNAWTAQNDGGACDYCTGS